MSGELNIGYIKITASKDFMERLLDCIETKYTIESSRKMRKNDRDDNYHRELTLMEIM